MENHQSLSLFSRSHVVLFILLLGVVIYMLVPKRADIASLRLSASQAESLQLTREGLDPSVFSDQPRLIRQWIQLLREDGRTREALVFARDLVRLRPKNKSYWNILLQALNDENQIAEEMAVRLRLIGDGMLEAARLDYLRIATTYKWLGLDHEYATTLETMLERKIYERDDVEALLQAYASPAYLSDGPKKTAALILKLKADGKLGPETHETLSALYASLCQPDLAARHAALAAGLNESAADDFVAGRASDTFNAAIAPLNPRQTEALVDLAHFHGRDALALPLYESLRRRGALGFTRYFEYINARIKHKDREHALRLAREIPQRLKLDSVQWFQLAQMFGQLGQREQSIRIMQRLLATR